jgi:hypothetical protein
MYVSNWTLSSGDRFLRSIEWALSTTILSRLARETPVGLSHVKYANEYAENASSCKSLAELSPLNSSSVKALLSTMADNRPIKSRFSWFLFQQPQAFTPVILAGPRVEIMWFQHAV